MSIEKRQRLKRMHEDLQAIQSCVSRLASEMGGMIYEESIVDNSSKRIGQFLLLKSFPEGYKIAVIKLLRYYLVLGLKESKDIVDNVPILAIEGCRDSAYQLGELAMKLREIGAVVDLGENK